MQPCLTLFGQLCGRNLVITIGIHVLRNFALGQRISCNVTEFRTGSNLSSEFSMLTNRKHLWKWLVCDLHCKKKKKKPWANLKVWGNQLQQIFSFLNFFIRTFLNFMKYKLETSWEHSKLKNLLKLVALNQGCLTLLLAIDCPAKFSPNSNIPASNCRGILNTSISFFRCVWLELELNFAGQSIAKRRVGHPSLKPLSLLNFILQYASKFASLLTTDNVLFCHAFLLMRSPHLNLDVLWN